MPRASERGNPPRNRRERPGAGLVEAAQGSPSSSRVLFCTHTSLSRTTRPPLPPLLPAQSHACSLPASLRISALPPSLPPPPFRAPGTRSRTLRRLHQSRAGGSAEQPLLPPPRRSSASPPGPALPVLVPGCPFQPSSLLPLQPPLVLSLAAVRARPATGRAGGRRRFHHEQRGQQSV